MGLFKLGLSIAIIPPTLLVSFILWENFIHYWHKPKRRNALESWLNETKSNQHLDNATSGEELESMLGKELSDSFYYFNLRMMRSLIVAGRYLNPFPEWQDRNILSVFEHLKWRLTRSNKRVKRMKDLVPVTEPNFKLLYNFHTISNESEMTATWIGQSTLFVQMQGLNILTDPHFSPRSTGNSWIGPKRLHKVPCQLEQLPAVDIVLVSHDHYDHLDANTVKFLNNDTIWVVPLGLGKLIQDMGVKNFVELDWWEEFEYKGVKLISTPCQHWSGRYILDTNKTLWCSFVVKGPETSFFHCGDTGYCKVFEQIGRQFGPFTLAALPIGSYEPRWFMKHQHINPKEAARIHDDIMAYNSIGVHWGTFVMSDEPVDEPPAEFMKQKVISGKLLVCAQGETLMFPSDIAQDSVSADYEVLDSTRVGSLG